ncbi:hypothetical protein K505DRAFT_364143 [Melanomma pulvis-pyrius CBS 109.77]|uniref:Uncharacterized protein n=1 Tax=Melanomma pulvis-pyrius CBS 109.77 TaxID=1314802 RepID=A0A6A6X4P5_9PLEO|nr:hypothetical protein K505DRAFT_364143 [Melanomma pulvis-pyrius CBS 109.77]
MDRDHPVLSMLSPQAQQNQSEDLFNQLVTASGSSNATSATPMRPTSRNARGTLPGRFGGDKTGDFRPHTPGEALAQIIADRKGSGAGSSGTMNINREFEYIPTLRGFERQVNRSGNPLSGNGNGGKGYERDNGHQVIRDGGALSQHLNAEFGIPRRNNGRHDNQRGTPLPINDNESYEVTLRDRQRLEREASRNYRVQTPIPRTSTDHDSGSKRVLSPTPSHYAEGSTPKRPLSATPPGIGSNSQSANPVAPPMGQFKLPALPRPHDFGNGKQNRLSLEAERHSAHRIDLSDQKFREVYRAYDPSALPGNHWGGSQTLRHAQLMAQVNKNWQWRHPDKNCADIFSGFTKMDQDYQAEAKKRGVRLRAVNEGRGGIHVSRGYEGNWSIPNVPLRKYIDANYSLPNAAETGKRTCNVFFDLSSPPTRISSTSEIETGLFNKPAHTNVLPLPDGVPPWNENQGGDLPNNVALCTVDEDGGLRAPDPEYVTEEHADLLYYMHLHDQETGELR